MESMQAIKSSNICKYFCRFESPFEALYEAGCESGRDAEHTIQ